MSVIKALWGFGCTFVLVADMGIRLGVNYVIYAMTH
jgi:hypothetical protein